MTLSFPEWERRVAALTAKAEAGSITLAETSHLNKLLGRRGKGHGYSREFRLSSIFQGGTQGGATGEEGTQTRIDGANCLVGTLYPDGTGPGAWSAGYNRTVLDWARKVNAKQEAIYREARSVQGRHGKGSLWAGVQISSSARMAYVVNRWKSYQGEWITRSRNGQWRDIVDARGTNAPRRLDLSEMRRKLGRVTESVGLEMAEALDKRGAEWAWETWRAWPAYSGASRAMLALEWYARNDGQIALRLVSMAPYTLAARSTRKAWGRARSGMSRVIQDVAIQVTRSGEVSSG